MKRKKIALVTAELGNIYQKRVMKGVYSQCAKYNYDVAVISPMMNTTHFMSDDLQGEINIFQLINFDLFDGVIITPSHLFGMDVKELEEEMLAYFKANCHCKVVALDLPFGDYETVYTDEAGEFYEITKHIYEKHWRQKVYFLNGFKGYRVSEERLSGFLRYHQEMGIEVPESHIFYGEFWYNNGEDLADKIYNKEVEMPDAVICASDHIAIGLVNRLTKYGIRVPEQIAVTGYDTTREAALNDIYVTSYEPKEHEVAARAVNIIHNFLEPEEPEQDTVVEGDSSAGLHCGESCGCSTDTLYLRKVMNEAMLHQKPNWNDIWAGKPIDISVLLESYMSESVMNVRDHVNCIDQIYHHVYLLHPYTDFWLCLKENWLDVNDVMTKGYPDKMKVCLHSQGQSDMGAATMVGFCDSIGPRTFDTKQMLPEMLENDDDTASVYYYIPIHVGAETLGYAVMKCPLTQEHKIGYVFHNWLRIVSNALSVTRLKNQLSELSMRDHVTNLLNRRGLQDWIQWKRNRKGSFYAIMVDMDGLKYVNDQFGHSEGDFGLITIAESLQTAVNLNETCARLGGDEFAVVGVGEFDDKWVQDKIRALQDEIARRSKASGKPYEISASMGYYMEPMRPDIDWEAMIENADVEMYRNKRTRHKADKKDEKADTK